ncbi:MAG: Maf family nucleotide pyrophosphatase [Bacteroidales bacterium]|nr:Maf family nucleotide pyrophosphatase [Bacteroidales bacterium]
MLENLNKYHIVLASASPRRRELLARLGINFEVELRPVVEDFPPGLPGKNVAVLLSRMKADAFEKDFFTNNTLLITADTVVCLEDEILGKPAEREEGIHILQKLSAKKHSVISAVNIRTRNKETNFSVCTDVYFKKLRMEEIIYYIDHFKPYDKAGAYGIQEWIGYVGIERIEGSFYNVMGLPVLKLYEELLKF